MVFDPNLYAIVIDHSIIIHLQVLSSSTNGVGWSTIGFAVSGGVQPTSVLFGVAMTIA
jgi:hypothetical protein